MYLRHKILDHLIHDVVHGGPLGQSSKRSSSFFEPACILIFLFKVFFFFLVYLAFTLFSVLAFCYVNTCCLCQLLLYLTSMIFLGGEEGGGHAFSTPFPAGGWMLLSPPSLLFASCFLFLHFKAFPNSSFDIELWSR